MKPSFVRCNEIVKKINEQELGESSIEVIQDEEGRYNLYVLVPRTGELIELAGNVPFVSYKRVD